MYNQRNRQYILKQSTGKVWNFFYDDKHGICYSTMTRRNTWVEPVALQRNAHSSFYIDLDYDDCFHLLFQDREGNIHYSHIENESIKTIPVLNSRNNTLYHKYFYLIPSKNNVQLFFVIEHNDQLILAHQVITDGKPGNPKVVDYIIRSEVPYTVIADRTGSVYAFYQSPDGQTLQLGYKKYITSQKYWSEFTPVTRYSGDCDFPRVISDSNGIIHICYQRRSERQLELVYQQKIPDRNIWSEEAVICGSNYTFTNNSILLANGKLVVYWIRDDIIQYSTSQDNGSTWTKPARLNFSVGRQLFCFNYKSNYPYENDKIISRDIPGNFISGFTLAFYQDSSSNIYSLSAEELRSMIVDTLKLLKANVEELRETMSGLKANMAELKASQQHLEKEVSKYTIRMNMPGGQVRQQRQSPSVPEGSYRDASLTDEQALELMKAEFLAENKLDTSYPEIMEKEILQKKGELSEQHSVKQEAEDEWSVSEEDFSDRNEEDK